MHKYLEADGVEKQVQLAKVAFGRASRALSGCVRHLFSRLRREFASQTNHPPSTRFSVLYPDSAHINLQVRSKGDLK